MHRTRVRSIVAVVAIGGVSLACGNADVEAPTRSELDDVISRVMEVSEETAAETQRGIDARRRAIRDQARAAAQAAEALAREVRSRLEPTLEPDAAPVGGD